jgi:mono/diheme cytochrome c family protein
MLSCGNESVKNNIQTSYNGEELYQKHCAICHGNDGKQGSGGAKDLSISAMGIEERINIIKNGKGGMTPFGSLLNDKEIKIVAEYLDNLKQ